MNKSIDKWQLLGKAMIGIYMKVPISVGRYDYNLNNHLGPVMSPSSKSEEMLFSILIVNWIYLCWLLGCS